MVERSMHAIRPKGLFLLGLNVVLLLLGGLIEIYAAIVVVVPLLVPLLVSVGIAFGIDPCISELFFSQTWNWDFLRRLRA